MSHYWGNWANQQTVVAVEETRGSIIGAGKETCFDASYSYDPDGAIVQYKWDFGDGSPLAYGAKVCHTYPGIGTYVVTLWLTDSTGGVTVRTTTITVVSGKVYGWVEFSNPYNVPLNGVKVTATMFNIGPGGDVRFSYVYPSVYTDSSGYYIINVASNPFSPLSADFYRFIADGGFTHVNLRAQSCNGSISDSINIPYNVTAVKYIKLHAHHTHKLTFKDSITGVALSGVTATYHDSSTGLPTMTSGSGNSVQWTDAHPLFITNVVTVNKYVAKSLYFDHRGINASSECTKEHEVLMDRLETTAIINFDKSRYYPEEVIKISYDSSFKLNCKVKLYDAGHNLIMLNLRSSYTESPPTVNYSIPGNSLYGQWLVVLEDKDGNELAHATTSVGTPGNLSYDVSMRCTEGKVKILWAGVEPVYKSGPSPNYMKLKLYDSVGILRGETAISTTTGSWYYSITGAENFDVKWEAKLIDQWGVTVNSILIPVFKECNQAIVGKVLRRNGTPVAGVTITMDLTFMGWGLKTATTQSSGSYTLTGLPPILPGVDMVASMAGFNSRTVSVTTEPGELKTVDFALEGLITGTVKDAEGTAITDPQVYYSIDGGYLNAVYYAGVYDIECLPGSVTLKCEKKNFQDYSNAVTVAGSQIIKNIVLLRPVPAERLVAVETAEARLDDSDSVIVFNNSGQDIAAVDQAMIETPHSYAPWGKYHTVHYLGTKYFAGYTTNSFLSDYQKISTLDNRRLHKVLIDDNTKRTISVGGTIALKEGYVLKARDIDLNARTILLSLLKDGDEINLSPLSAGETYIHKKNFSGVYLPIIAIRFEDVFSGQELQVAFIKGMFQVSEYYFVVDAPLPPSEKYLLRAGSRDTTGAYHLDSSSDIVIELNGGT